MKKRTAEEGQELVEKYRASGLTQENFAKQARINVAVLRYWLRKERQPNEFGTDKVRFIELTPSDERSGQSPVCIEKPSGVFVSLDRLPSAEYLVDLVLGLGRL